MAAKMMLENHIPAGDPKEGAIGEESELLLAPPSSSSATGASFAIFNDLTYSDDDDDVEATDEYWQAAELGTACGSVVIPDTAALLDEIRDAVFLAQQRSGAGAVTAAQRRQQQHLVHPLASDGDENSYLAYSIASEETGSDGNKQRQVTVSTSYGSLDVSVAEEPLLDSRPNKLAAAVIFRPPSVSVFDQSSTRLGCWRQRPKRPRKSRERDARRRSPRRQGRRQSSPTKVPSPATRPRHVERPRTTWTSASQSHPATPLLPTALADSPVTSATSATATDDTHSPNNGDAADDVKEGDGEGVWPEERARIAEILGAEATSKLRSHRRLRRIKSAAEVREAAVQKVRGTEQVGRCNDAVFAFIFLFQFLLVSMSALAFGPGALRDKIYGSLVGERVEGGRREARVDYIPLAGLKADDVIINLLLDMGGAGADAEGGGIGDPPGVRGAGGVSHIDCVNVIQLVCITSVYASLCSLLVLGFMMMLSRSLLRVALVFGVSACATWTVLGLALGGSYPILPLSGAAALVLSLTYASVVWDRVPFAATNLVVALGGMRGAPHVPLVGLWVLAATFLWTMWWIYAFAGTVDFLGADEGLGDRWMSAVVAFFLFSYYWTFQVIKGISQTAVASIIGKWWDMPEDNLLPMCSSILCGALSRNIIGSLGSICLGSLLVGPCIFLARISTFSRLAVPKFSVLRASLKAFGAGPSSNQCEGDGDSRCMHKSLCALPLCLSGGVISKYVNQWSFTYIGLYGYRFWESGSMALQLFEARGWTHFVSDDLVMTAMAMSSMIIAGSTACLGLLVEEMDGYTLTSLDKPIMNSFLIGLFVGFSLSSAFLSIIEGSVSAILVCYAAAPVAFHSNHHKLSDEMKSIWKHSL